MCNFIQERSCTVFIKSYKINVFFCLCERSGFWRGLWGIKKICRKNKTFDFSLGGNLPPTTFTHALFFAFFGLLWYSNSFVFYLFLRSQYYQNKIILRRRWIDLDIISFGFGARIDLFMPDNSKWTFTKAVFKRLDENYNAACWWHTHTNNIT